MFSKFRLAALAAGLVLSSSSAFAQDVTKIKFTLDWKLQGIHAWYYWAQEKGYFEAERLDVTIDQGEGSAATVTRIMSGAYDAGFGDINAVIQNAATKPGRSAGDGLHDLQQGAVRAADQGVKPDQDDQGHRRQEARLARRRRLAQAVPAAGQEERSRLLARSISLNMAPNLQEQMLLQGQVDIDRAVHRDELHESRRASSSIPTRISAGSITRTSALDLYSNGVMVSQKLAKEKPEAVKGLVRAINKAMKECIANPDAAIELLAKQEPLINKDIEKRRLIYVAKTLIATPEAPRARRRRHQGRAHDGERPRPSRNPSNCRSPEVRRRVQPRLPAAEGRADAAGSGELTNIAEPAIVGRGLELAGHDDA